MHIDDLDYSYPEQLIATKPAPQSRVLVASMQAASLPEETDMQGLIKYFKAGDILVINETKVIKKKLRASTPKGKTLEVLFLKALSETEWQVLLPLKKLGAETELIFPADIRAQVIKGGMPQTIKFDSKLGEDFFSKHGRMPLPAYIEKQRNDLDIYEDETWYQSAWAKVSGSAAAPTASLHFKAQDIAALKQIGVIIVPVCLHVGLGTFQPIQSVEIENHKMHFEEIFISKENLDRIHQRKGRVWALGTTVVRALESLAQDKLKKDEQGNFSGESDLYIYPGYKFKLVDNLLTNFHQPKSSLIAMVAAFAGLDNVKRNYAWAIEKKFRLFSYGDLSVWMGKYK